MELEKQNRTGNAPRSETKAAKPPHADPTSSMAPTASAKSRRKPSRRAGLPSRKRIEDPTGHADALNRLHRVQGQLAGIERMIVEDRYCDEILNQMKAVHAALKSLEGSVLAKHLRACVVSALESKGSKQAEDRIGELLSLFARS